MKTFLFWLVGLVAPEPYAENWLGDLAEESLNENFAWLVKHALVAALFGLRLRLARGSMLESMAATAFLIGPPLVAVLELRRYALTLIPYRESAAYSLWVVVLLALMTGSLAAWETRLMGRRWAAVMLAGACTGSIGWLMAAPYLVLTVATLTGGSLAMRFGGAK